MLVEFFSQLSRFTGKNKKNYRGRQQHSKRKRKRFRKRAKTSEEGKDRPEPAALDAQETPKGELCMWVNGQLPFEWQSSLLVMKKYVVSTTDDEGEIRGAR